jgi:hypothetical protein
MGLSFTSILFLRQPLDFLGPQSEADFAILSPHALIIKNIVSSNRTFNLEFIL